MTTDDAHDQVPEGLTADAVVAPPSRSLPSDPFRTRPSTLVLRVVGLVWVVAAACLVVEFKKVSPEHTSLVGIGIAMLLVGSIVSLDKLMGSARSTALSVAATAVTALFAYVIAEGVYYSGASLVAAVVVVPVSAAAAALSGMRALGRHGRTSALAATLVGGVGLVGTGVAVVPERMLVRTYSELGPGAPMEALDANYRFARRWMGRGSWHAWFAGAYAVFYNNPEKLHSDVLDRIAFDLAGACDATDIADRDITEHMTAVGIYLVEGEHRVEACRIASCAEGRDDGPCATLASETTPADDATIGDH